MTTIYLKAIVHPDGQIQLGQDVLAEDERAELEGPWVVVYDGRKQRVRAFAESEVSSVDWLK